ncbi:hypothetical protein GCM10023172_25820 [Hymenobacter ginsengisoli]|uniref:Integrase catalytic domain-containing protein n=1 Tax=Hymenobacter ginsengisoli TaxID=1051626 RepID=A0ABP8QK77_9BACT
MPLRATGHDSAPILLGTAPLLPTLRYQPPAAKRRRAKPAEKKFKDYPVGYLHVDFAEVQTEAGRLYFFVAIDRTSKVAFAELHPRAKQVVATEFLRRVLDKLPYKEHTVLMDNGLQFTPQPHQFLPGGHSFDRICREYGVEHREHRLTKPAHPWINGQVERMNCTIKKATVQRFHYRPPASTSTCKPFCWPITMPSEDFARADPTRICLRSVAKEPYYLYPRPDPPHDGTIHLINQLRE